MLRATALRLRPSHLLVLPSRCLCATSSGAPGAALLRVRINRVPGPLCDALEDALLGSGALSTSTSDAEAGTAAETPFYALAGQPIAPSWSAWRSCEVTALFADAEAWAEAQEAAELALGGRSVADAVTEPALDADWEAAIRAQYKPLKVADGLWVVPEWSAGEPLQEPGAQAIVLQPGLAFGTGEHPTTRLCLRWLKQHIRGGERVLDVGTGSGVLALASLLCGAKLAAGSDTDPVSVSSANANAGLNGLTDRFEAVLVDASSDPPPEPSWRLGGVGTGVGKFDVVVANILLGPLLGLQPMLARHCAPGGRVVLSGLLATQAPQVVEAYAKGGFQGLQVETEGEWALVSGTWPAAGR